MSNVPVTVFSPPTLEDHLAAIWFWGVVLGFCIAWIRAGYVKNSDEGMKLSVIAFIWPLTLPIFILWYVGDVLYTWRRTRAN